MPVVRDIVQLRPLGVHVWLLVPMLLVPMLLVLGLLRLAELLSILLRWGRGMAEARSERGVLLVVRRLRLAPLLGRIGLSREGGVDSVARPGGHESGVDEVCSSDIDANDSEHVEHATSPVSSSQPNI